MGLREKRLFVALAFHLGVLALGACGVFLGTTLNFHPFFDAGGLLLLLHLLAFQRIPLARLLQERLLGTHRCDGCELALDLVASWRCHCGFVSQERHAFSPCPQCGKGFAWINCPRCGRSILI